MDFVPNRFQADMTHSILTEPMNQRRFLSEAFLLLVFFSLAYLFPLGYRDLVIPDETRYAEIPREMIASGDWVTPRLNGLRYFEKPVMGYWIHAASLLVFGETNFAVRFPSVAAVACTALLLYRMTRRVVLTTPQAKGNGFCADWTALVYLSNILVFGIGNTAVLDSLFSFFVTASIAAFFWACEAQSGSRTEKIRLALSGMMCGIGFLTKGFLAIALPVVTVVPFLLWERRMGDIFRMAWIPVLTACLTVLPWGIAVHMREPEFWRFFFWNEHIRRFMAKDAQHAESFWFFFALAPVLFVPWTFLTPAAAAGLQTRIQASSPAGRLIRFSLCWLLLPFLVFSVSKGKLVTYILPCFPPLAILTAFGLDAVFREGRRIQWVQWGVLADVLLFVLVGIAFVFVQWIGIEEWKLFKVFWKYGVFAVGLTAAAICCFWAYRHPTYRSKMLLVGFAPLVLFWGVHYTTPDRVIETQSPGPFLAKIGYNPARDVVILCDEESTAAVCWYYKRRDIHIVGLGGELDYGLQFPDATGRQLRVEDTAGWIRRHKGGILLVAQTKHIHEWRSWLPEPIFEVQSSPSGFSALRF